MHRRKPSGTRVVLRPLTTNGRLGLHHDWKRPDQKTDQKGRRAAVGRRAALLSSACSRRVWILSPLHANRNCRKLMRNCGRATEVAEELSSTLGLRAGVGVLSSNVIARAWVGFVVRGSCSASNRSKLQSSLVGFRQHGRGVTTTEKRELPDSPRADALIVDDRWLLSFSENDDVWIGFSWIGRNIARSRPNHVLWRILRGNSARSDPIRDRVRVQRTGLGKVGPVAPRLTNRDGIKSVRDSRRGRTQALMEERWADGRYMGLGSLAAGLPNQIRCSALFYTIQLLWNVLLTRCSEVTSR